MQEEEKFLNRRSSLGNRGAAEKVGGQTCKNYRIIGSLVTETQSQFKKCWEIVVNSIKPSKSVKPDNSNLIVINDLSMNGVGLCILVYTGTQSVVISKAAVDKIGD